MRITQSMYANTQNADRNKVDNKLFDVNKQISSGSKIKYAYESPTTFANTLRLDDEINTFDQVTTSVESGLKFSQQTDSTIGEFTKTLDQFKTKLIQSASDANSPASMAALAGEMRGIEKQLRNLANTSINGQYLFSGSLVDQKPIDNKGNYLGNDESMTSFLGSNVRQPYNVTGQDLFLGQESTQKRKITTNVQHLNQSELFPDVMIDPIRQRSSGTQKFITVDDTIRDLMGDTDNIANTTDTQNHFYISGTSHNGSSFKTTIDMRDDESVGDLLNNIGKAYGNTSTNKVVKVSLNDYGQIEIEDALAGSSKLDFHILSNIDVNGPATNLNDLNTNGTKVVEFTKSEISNYQTTIGQQRDQFNPDSFMLNMDLRTKSGELATYITPLKEIFRSDIDSITLGGTKTDGAPMESYTADTPPVPIPTLFNITDTTTVEDLVNAIKSSYQVAGDDLNVNLSNGRINFSTKSGQDKININLSSNDASSNPIEALTPNASICYDDCKFKKAGNRLLSNVVQIVKADNAFATASTKLSEVSGASPFVDSATGVTQQLKLDGIDINGNHFTAQIDIAQGGSTFSVDGGVTNYNIYDIEVPRKAVNGNNMTYKQLSDVINMVVSGVLPASTNNPDDYDTAIASADNKSSVKLDAKGQINFEQNDTKITKADISLYDVNSANLAANSSSLRFNANSSITISDPKTDFFAAIDEVIKSVEQNKSAANDKTGDLRNVGIQNAIQVVDDLNDHVAREQSKSGVQSQSLQAASDRTKMLVASAKGMRSDVIDTDIADATMKLNQLQLNNQAIYSTIGKVSKLSLVNYL
ncbi:flagellar hook-associated protein FlgL [bacterium]|nr:flagellar hook-associated protein FlgL [bacterium]